ncbi:hypothetical protein [Arcanobacterium hippocoleae]|uniref:Gram-positive cocci surface proteins LPxTG domain-containing protein n=1 Tax=Arcanobacterium hippocoleae TaxID=149017 RepID=A0ABU1T3P5_9ACTO|nr:hypothetical protein [Arcanobacterium hippocoleae]MDR6940011.1 hypothetical protein [Arcanobacterium hippocoleae]
MKRLRIPAALALGALLALSGGTSVALAAPPASTVTASKDFHVYPISEGENIIMGKDTPGNGNTVTVKLPGGQSKSVPVNGGGYWFYTVPKGTVLQHGQTVTLTDSKKHQTSVTIGKKTVVNQPVEGQDIVTGTAQPGTYLTVTVRDKKQNSAIVDIAVKTIAGNNGEWSTLIGRALNVGEEVIVSQSYKENITKEVKAKESQNVTVSVVYNKLRADGGFEQIPGTGRVAVLSQPSLSPDGSNLKIDLTGFEKLTVKGLPWNLIDVKFPDGITADPNSPRKGEINRRLDGELVINLIYEKGYASVTPLTQSEKPAVDKFSGNALTQPEKPAVDKFSGNALTQPEKPAVDKFSGNALTQPEKPAVDKISGTPLVQPEKPKGEIGISGAPLTQPEKPAVDKISGTPLVQPEKPKGEIGISGAPLTQPAKPALDPNKVKAAKTPELSKTGADVEGLLAGSLALIILGGAAFAARRKFS